MTKVALWIIAPFLMAFLWIIKWSWLAVLWTARMTWLACRAATVLTWRGSRAIVRMVANVRHRGKDGVSVPLPPPSS